MSLHDELIRTARRTMLGQISTTDRLIRQLYIRAAKSLGERIAKAKKGSLTERWLISYKKAIEEEIEALGRGIYSAIEEGARNAAQARADAEATWLRTAAMQAQIDDRFTATFSTVPTDALRAMMDGKLYTDGRMLSKRIWDNGARLEGNIAEIIQQGIAQKLDALTLARQLEAYVNPKAACPVSWHTIYPDIPFDRKIDYNALRLARTSIIHAHWAAEKASAHKNPMCRGLKWNLSDSHYERQVEKFGEDVCDEYARHDEGMGIGVYPIDRIPFPHPQCLCYRTEALPTIAEAAEMLSKTEAISDAERHRTAWARGEVRDVALDADYEKWRQEKMAAMLDKFAENATMEEEDIYIPRSLGAKATNHNIELPDGSIAHLTEGTRITSVKIIAGNGRERAIDCIDTLMERFPDSKELEWTKRKGIGFIDFRGESYRAELHWYEEPSTGRVDFKVKMRDGRWFIDE